MSREGRYVKLASLVHPAVAARIEELDEDAEIVCICHHGARSMQVAAFLERNGFSKLYNLTGGVHAWAVQVDATMPKY